MAADLIAPMAVLPLINGCTMVAEARDPTTFAAVAGVVISQFTFYAIDSGTGSTTLADVFPTLTPTVA